MTQPDQSDIYVSPIILSRDETLAGEEIEDVTKAVKAGVLVRCPYGITFLLGEPARSWPCGYTHQGDGFYHYLPGKAWVDYEEATR